MFTVYKITNLVNSKYYIGVHKTNNPYDNYMGSGIAIKNAIEKHGIENFKKEVLFLFEDENSAYEKEKELLQNLWKLSECYNMTEGGIGSWSHIDSRGNNNCMKNPDIVKKVIATTRANGSYHTEKKLNASRKNAVLGYNARKGMKDTVETKSKRNDSVKKVLSNPETRQKLINSIREKKCVPYELTDPTGVKYETEVISELCVELNIPLSTVTTRCDGRQIKKGVLKGWIILKKGGNC